VEESYTSQHENERNGKNNNNNKKITYKIQVMEPNGKGPHRIPRHAKREEY